MLLKNVAVDFDFTLVRGDKPIGGAKEAMQWLREKGFNIIIFSCNRKQWIQKVLDANQIPYDYIYDSNSDVGKPACDWYIDDRGLRFTGDWNATLKDLEDWYKKELAERERLTNKYANATTETGQE